MSKQNTRATIDANIKQNGQQQITGQILNSALNTMVTDYAEQEKLTDLERKVDGVIENESTQDRAISDLRDQVENYKPIEITGNVTNAPDEEDLTSINGLLKFKNRSSLNGMGYIILRRDKSFAEQVTIPNTIYEIRYNFDLENGTVTIPNGCVLKFNGGKLSDGIIDGAYCRTCGNVQLENISVSHVVGSPFYDKGTVNLVDLGCTDKESDAAKNVSIINDALKKYTTLVVPILIPIDSPIIIDSSHHTFKGIDRLTTGFRQITDGKDIFQIILHNLTQAVTISNLVFRELNLVYKTWQKNYADTAVFQFISEKTTPDGTTPWSWGWQQIYAERLYVQNASNIGRARYEPVWNTYWRDIIAYDITTHAFSFPSQGQLINMFDTVSVLNYNHRNPDNTAEHNNHGACFQIKGETSLLNLDIEDWYGSLYINESALCQQIKNCHFERDYLTDNTLSMLTVTDNAVIESNYFIGLHITSGKAGPVGIVRSVGTTYRGSIVNNRIYSIQNDSAQRVNWYVQSEAFNNSCIINGNSSPSGVNTILPYGYGDYAYRNRLLFIDGVRILFDRVLSYDGNFGNYMRECVVGDVVKLSSHPYIGYAICTTTNTNETPEVGDVFTVNYSSTIECSESFYNKTGTDYGVFIPGTGLQYIVTQKRVQGGKYYIVLDKPVLLNVTNTPIRLCTVKECFRDIDGNKLNVAHYGATANRPQSTDIIIGFKYFDTTLGMPIYWNGTSWVDATGIIV